MAHPALYVQHLCHFCQGKILYLRCVLFVCLTTVNIITLHSIHKFSTRQRSVVGYDGRYRSRERNVGLHK